MTEALLIRNFRCFENLELHGLKRINVVVGRNSTGKTTLLESMFLAAGGSPELALRLRYWRGMGSALKITLDRSSYESVWKDLFCSFDRSRTISIQLLGSPSHTRSLTIAYKDAESLTL
ncbi:MAG: AAA family ATPase, partial [Terriglobia bacterium]